MQIILTATLTVSIPIDVHPIEGGGFWGEPTNLPGCVTQADTLEEFKVSMIEALKDHLEATPGMTEKEHRELAALQGIEFIPDRSYPRLYTFDPSDLPDDLEEC